MCEFEWISGAKYVYFVIGQNFTNYGQNFSYYMKGW